MSNLRIGVPSKGRLSDLAGELLKQAGLPFRRQERRGAQEADGWHRSEKCREGEAAEGS